VSQQPISARDAFAQMSARHAEQNPWTAADEARWAAKRAAEHAVYAAFQAACADEPCEEDEDDGEQEGAS
jgi:hypothetical protein